MLFLLLDRVDTLSATGNLFVYSGLGIVKFFPGKTDLITDIIPCDFVANIILSSIAAVSICQLSVFVKYVELSDTIACLGWLVTYSHRNVTRCACNSRVNIGVKSFALGFFRADHGALLATISSQENYFAELSLHDLKLPLL